MAMVLPVPVVQVASSIVKLEQGNAGGGVAATLNTHAMDAENTGSAVLLAETCRCFMRTALARSTPPQSTAVLCSRH